MGRPKNDNVNGKRKALIKLLGSISVVDMTEDEIKVAKDLHNLLVKNMPEEPKKAFRVRKSNGEVVTAVNPTKKGTGTEKETPAPTAPGLNVILPAPNAPDLTEDPLKDVFA